MMKWDKYLTTIVYVVLVVAAGLCFWSFFRADLYRVQTDEIMSQTFEIQDRASQAREKLAAIKGYLFIAAATDKAQPRLLPEAMLLAFNLKALLQLDYVDRFLDASEIDMLDRTVAQINATLLPHIRANNHLDEALQSVTKFETDVFRISGATLAHSLTLRATAAIEARAIRNKLLFAVGVLVLSIALLFVLQQSSVARRKDHHIRSFASLFAHMTRSRIAALRMFLDRDGPPSPEALAGARSTIAELDDINEGMMTVGHARTRFKTAALGDLLGGIEKNCQVRLQMEIEDDAGAAVVPAYQFHLLIDELVQNSVTAVAEQSHPLITIKAQVRHRFWRRAQLVLTVSDNGVGMPASMLAKVREPFFSTKAGTHVGLGLTNCVELVRTMAGKLKIISAPDKGTIVRIVYVL